MQPTAKKVGALVLAVVILSVGGLIYKNQVSEDARPAASSIPAQRAVPVQRKDIVKVVSGTGRITPDRDLELTFDVSGKVKSILVESTQPVKKGQVLAQLDNSNQELAYLSAKRELELARLDSAPNVVKEKELAMKLAKADLDATVLTAPFDGVVASVYIEEGEMVNTSTKVIRLIDPSRFYVEVNVDEVDVRYVKLGQPVTITLDAYPDLVLTGKVVEIGIVPSSQGEIVLFPVKVELDSADPRVRSGMSAEAEIVVDKAEGALVVPLDAVIENNGRSLVTVVTPDGPRPTPVATGISDGMYVQIVRGLKEGDMVLASNYQLYQRLLGNGGSAPSSGRPGGPMPFGGVRVGGSRR